MKPLKIDEVANTTKIEELDKSTDVNAPIEPVKLTDDTSEKPEEPQEEALKLGAQDTEEQPLPKIDCVIVTYIGNGIWKDRNKELWANADTGSSIRKSRRYRLDEYEQRNDIKFMVEYGAMDCIKA